MELCDKVRHQVQAGCCLQCCPSCPLPRTRPPLTLGTDPWRIIIVMGGRRSSACGRPLLPLPEVSPAPVAAPANAAKALRAGGAGGFPEAPPPPAPRGVLRPDADPAAGTSCRTQGADGDVLRQVNHDDVCFQRKKRVRRGHVTYATVTCHSSRQPDSNETAIWQAEHLARR